MQNTGLLLEGGAMRSIFTAGVLDCFLDKDFYIPNIITTSAGAYAGMNYISRQRGRTVTTNVDTFRKGDKYIGLKTFFKTHGNLFDMDKLFDLYPNKLYPYDYDAFYNSGIHFQVSTTDCVNGKAVYFEDFGDRKRLMDIMRASNSLPLISRVVYVDGVPMLDGGMLDPIPIRRALQEKWDKIVVVLTQQPGYRKKDRSFYVAVLKLLYRRFPNFLREVEGRPQKYNMAVELVEQLEREKKIFVLQPTVKPVSNKTTDPNKLTEFYQHGYETCKEKFEELMHYLNS